MASADSTVLRGAIPVTVGVGAVGTAIGWFAAGGAGALGAIIGTIIVVVFFSVGQLALGSVLRTRPDMALTVAMGIYLLKIGVLLVFIILFQDTSLWNTKVFALTIVCCTLAWTITEVTIFARTKVLYVEPGSGPGRQP